MSPGDVKLTWPLHRLASMLQDAKSREKDSWKESPLSPTTSMKDVCPENRDEVVVWIAELNTLFAFHPETFFLAVSILDRFLTSVKAQPKYLKCIAISCFYLSSKITEEEDMIPCTGELVENSGCGCRVCDVLRMERIILDKLCWEINSSTAWHYLHIFQVLAFYHYTDLYTRTPVHRLLSTVTSDLTRALCHYEVSLFPNAVVALALLSFELESIPDSSASWTAIISQLQSLAQIKTSAFMECRDVLSSKLTLKCLDAKLLHSICRIRPISAVDSNALISSKILRLEAPQAAAAGAVKRKATSPELPAKLDAPRKAHSGNSWTPLTFDCPIESMEVAKPAKSLDYDSDATLTASEDEGDMAEIAPAAEECDWRPLTYAEIVKCGISLPIHASVQDPPRTDSARVAVTTFRKRCRLQAAYGAEARALLSMSDRLAPSVLG